MRADGRVTKPIAQAALELYEVDELGLDRLDRAVLDAMCRRFGGGPVGLSTLAISVGEERETVEEVAEPFLVRQGFLMRTPRGRVATAAAWRHLGLTPPAGTVGPLRLRISSPDGRVTWGFSARLGRVRRSVPFHRVTDRARPHQPNAGAMRQYQTLIMIALMVVAFYFLIMRPQRKRQQAIQKTMSELTPGTRVLLDSGMFGTVLAVGDRSRRDRAPPGVELTVLKQAIARVVDRGRRGHSETSTSSRSYDDPRRRGRRARSRADAQRAVDRADARAADSASPGPTRAPRPRTDLTPPLRNTHVATPTGHPGRTLIVLGVIVAGLIGLMAVSDTWTPEAGTRPPGRHHDHLTAANTTGTGTVDPTSLELAKTIIQNRVDSLGVGESEVTTAGDKQIVVTVPNVQQDELVRLVGQTAVLRFRAVYAAEQVAPPSPPRPTPRPAPTVTTAPGPSASAVGRPTNRAPVRRSRVASTTGNSCRCRHCRPHRRNRREACHADGPGTPPDQAMEWQPSET